MSEEAKWYVVHTYSGYENKVAKNLEKFIENRKLEHLIQDIKMPFETVVERENNKIKESERKLFPSYVLVKMIMTDESWHVVRNIRGVTSFVGPGSKPIPLTDEEVAKFEIDPVVIELDFNVGDNITIISGPLSGSIGIVEEIAPDKKKIKVTTSMFGRQTTVELDSGAVEAVKNE